MTNEHPAFLKAPEKYRWYGEKLAALWLLLDREAKDNRPTLEQLEEDKGWSWRILPRGLVVALRKREDLWYRFELRLARVEAPTDAKGWKAWDREVAIFLNAVTIRPLDGETPCRHVHRDWYRVPAMAQHPNDEGKAAVRFLELREAEIRPGLARCWGHLQKTGEHFELEWFPGSAEKNQLCSTCSLDRSRGLLPNDSSSSTN